MSSTTISFGFDFSFLGFGVVVFFLGSTFLAFGLAFGLVVDFAFGLAFSSTTRFGKKSEVLKTSESTV